MFRESASLGALFLATIAIGAYWTGSTTLSAFIQISPIVTLAAGLGIGAGIDFVAGFAYDEFLAQPRRRTIRLARQLPEYRQMRDRSRHLFYPGAAIRFDRNRVAIAAMDYHIASKAPGALVQLINTAFARARTTLLGYLTVILGLQVVSLLDDSPKAASNDLLFLVTVIVGLPVSFGAIRRRLYAELLREQFLADSVGDPTASPAPSFGVALPAIGGIGFFMGAAWLWRMWRARAAIRRHRQRVRDGKTRRAARNPEW